MSEIPTPETLERERDEAHGLAQQMSESNQVLLAELRYYRNLARRLERERDQLRSQRDGAREVAKFWQEQYGEAYPNHQWVNLPWEDRE